MSASSQSASAAPIDRGVQKLARYTYIAVLAKLKREFGDARLSPKQLYAATAEVMAKILHQPVSIQDVQRYLDEE